MVERPRLRSLDAVTFDTTDAQTVRPYKSLFVLLFYNGRTDRASLQDDVGGMGMDAETTTVGTLGLSVRCRMTLTTLVVTEFCRDARSERPSPLIPRRCNL